LKLNKKFNKKKINSKNDIKSNNNNNNKKQKSTVLKKSKTVKSQQQVNIITIPVQTSNLTIAASNTPTATTPKIHKNPSPIKTRDISIDSIKSTNNSLNLNATSDTKFYEIKTEDVSKLETSVNNNNNEQIDIKDKKESQSTCVVVIQALQNNNNNNNNNKSKLNTSSSHQTVIRVNIPLEAATNFIFKDPRCNKDYSLQQNITFSLLCFALDDISKRKGGKNCESSTTSASNSPLSSNNNNNKKKHLKQQSPVNNNKIKTVTEGRLTTSAVASSTSDEKNESINDIDEQTTTITTEKTDLIVNEDLNILKSLVIDHLYR
jgi:hypothetical protein